MITRYCDSCDKDENKSKGGLYKFICRVCRCSYKLCDNCATVTRQSKKCVECVNDGK